MVDRPAMWSDRLKERMTELGWNKAELHRRSDVSYDNVNKYLRGGVDQPRGKTMRMLANALGVNELWLKEGIGPKEGKRSPKLARKESPSQPELGDPRIRELDFRFGGGGAGMDAYTKRDNELVVSEESIRSEWTIPETYMRGQLRVDPRRAWIVEVYGDSMYDPANPNAPGSLFPGDRVIIDTGDQRPSPPGPFAVYDGVGMVIKLVEVLASEPSKVRLSSRNPSYSPYDVTSDEARIIGRVRGRISAM